MSSSPAQIPFTVAPGRPIWVDHTNHHPATTHAFYAALFGWQLDDRGPDFGHYTVAFAEGSPAAGFMQAIGPDGSPEPQIAPTWMVYFATDDIEAACRRAVDAGGQVLAEPLSFDRFGSLAVIADPSGAGFALWEAGTYTGFDHLSPGARPQLGLPVWFELMSIAYDRVLPFYQEVLGWQPTALTAPEASAGSAAESAPEASAGSAAESAPADQPRYATNHPGTAASAGICDAAAWCDSSFWRVYFAVADVDATVEALIAAGGQLLDGPIDSPFGRVATVADPEGASFQLVRPAALD